MKDRRGLQMPRDQDPGHNGQHAFASLIHSVVFTPLILRPLPSTQNELSVMRVEQRLSGLAFEARPPMLEPRFGPAIRCRRSDVVSLFVRSPA